jgi:hypothetical protein
LQLLCDRYPFAFRYFCGRVAIAFRSVASAFNRYCIAMRHFVTTLKSLCSCFEDAKQSLHNRSVSALKVLCYRFNALFSHFNRFTIFAATLQSLCYRSTISLQSPRDRFTIALQLLCHCFAIVMQSLCNCSAVALQSFYYGAVIA